MLKGQRPEMENLLPVPLLQLSVDQQAPKKVGEKAEIIMGTSLDPQLNGKIQIMVLATGVKTKFDVTPRQGKGFGVDIDSIS